MQEEKVCKILQHLVIINKDASTAQEKLLQLPGLANYHKNLRTEDEKEHFVRHLRKYVNMYLPDCPFEVVTTNRYTIETAEAAVTARKRIRKGETIKYLNGIQVQISEKEEKELSNRTDFSIVVSSRKKRPSLFLGPARFANHDCDSNARLDTSGAHGIHIIAKRDIGLGEEVTVNYGEDYFGIDNRECLCKTCEKQLRNGWDPRGPIIHQDSDDDDSSPGEESRPSTPPAPVGERPGKRKREGQEEDTVQAQGAVPLKRGPGRPRKYARKEEAPAAGVSVQPEIRRLVDNKHEPGDGNGRLTPSKSLDDHTKAAALSKSQLATTTQPAPSPRLAYPQTTEERTEERTEEQKRDPILDKVLRLLGSVADRADRRWRTADPANFGAPQALMQPSPAPSSNDVEMVDADPFNQDQEGEHMRNGRFAVRGQRGRFSKHSGGDEAQSRRNSLEAVSVKQESEADTPTKLPSIKKMRSYSSLRNVLNADDTNVDPYSIPSSPAPTEGRRRGRPKKHARPEDSTDDSSPSSQGADSSSAASQASSSTSIETFGATRGNVTHQVCDMFVVDDVDDKQTTLTPHLHVTKAPTSTRHTRSSIRQKQLEDEKHLSAKQAEREKQPRRKSPRSGPIEPSTEPVRSIEKVEDDDEDVERGPPRTPGDYHLCESLLSTTYHRWVECRNCDEFFVQPEAFQTRIACPRCERHSKLYGYYWPKTDKEGKHDKEERILDHRQIHRFIDPEEERYERKGRKALFDVLREKEVSEQQESESPDRLEGSGRRFRMTSPRRSESRVKRRTRSTM